MGNFWPEWRDNKLFTIIVFLAMIGVIGVLGALFAKELKNYQYIGKPSAERDIIAISGEGKVTGIPDVAAVQVGLITEKNDVKSAQTENTNKLNSLIKVIKDLGVEDKDIQTSYYNIYPQYDWVEGKQQLRGYQVNQGVSIKIRNLAKIGEILAAAGEGGANQVSGLTFNIDDPEKLRQEARLKALENAKEKAEALAKAAGVKLGKVVSFSEYSNSPADYSTMLDSYGGSDFKAASPTIESGSIDIVVTATVGYEIK
jgi:uncharacterized protein YggE